MKVKILLVAAAVGLMAVSAYAVDPKGTWAGEIAGAGGAPGTPFELTITAVTGTGAARTITGTIKIGADGMATDITNGKQPDDNTITWTSAAIAAPRGGRGGGGGGAGGGGGRGGGGGGGGRGGAGGGGGGGGRGGAGAGGNNFVAQAPAGGGGGRGAGGGAAGGGAPAGGGAGGGQGRGGGGGGAAINYRGTFKGATELEIVQVVATAKKK